MGIINKMQNIINLDQKLNIPSVQIDILRKDFISTDIFFKDIVQFIDYNDEILIFDVYTCLLLLDLSLRNENKTNRPLTSKDNLNILKSLLVLNEEIVKRNNIRNSVMNKYLKIAGNRANINLYK